QVGAPVHGRVPVAAGSIGPGGGLRLDAMARPEGHRHREDSDRRNVLERECFHKMSGLVRAKEQKGTMTLTSADVVCFLRKYDLDWFEGQITDFGGGDAILLPPRGKKDIRFGRNNKHWHDPEKRSCRAA